MTDFEEFLTKKHHFRSFFFFQVALKSLGLTTVPVQVRPAAPNKNKTNLDKKSKFVLFFTKDYFGLIIKLK